VPGRQQLLGRRRLAAVRASAAPTARMPSESGSACARAGADRFLWPGYPWPAVPTLADERPLVCPDRRCAFGWNRASIKLPVVCCAGAWRRTFEACTPPSFRHVAAVMCSDLRGGIRGHNRSTRCSNASSPRDCHALLHPPRRGRHSRSRGCVELGHAKENSVDRAGSATTQVRCRRPRRHHLDTFAMAVA